MNPSKLIIKKRDNHSLTRKEIHYFISEYVKNGKVTDYQMSAMLMAIVFNGMSEEEVYYLTDEYIKSGISIVFTNQDGKYIDKHSTGGVGDKISLILAPIAAECGVKVPMISGRGLGHTGGTLDKLESIPGFITQISIERFKTIIKENGYAIISQSDKIVPADRKIYALRDVTGTVESIPLITASIMSKKIASGIDGLVIDLKVGHGAFIGTMKRAKELAYMLTYVAKKFNKKIRINYTDMDTPLGMYIGNGLEVIESIEFLKGNMASDLKEITYRLVEDMLLMTDVVKDRNHASQLIDKAISSGKALRRFQKFIELQKGNPSVIDDYSILPQSKHKLVINAKESGYIKKILSRDIGYALIDVRAGRKKMDDDLDYASGLKLFKTEGDQVQKGEPIAELYYDNDMGEKAAKDILRSFIITNHKVKVESRILGSFNQ